MILKKFVVWEMANNDYLLMDNGEAVLIDATLTIPELDSVLKENNVTLKSILLTQFFLYYIITRYGIYIFFFIL